MKKVVEQTPPAVHLAARIDRGEIAVSLTDTRAVARWAQVPYDAERLQALTRAAAAPGAESGAGIALFEVLLPGAVGAFLRKSPARHLNLQLAPELDPLGWELASDGAQRVGEKFIVSRSVFDDDPEGSSAGPGRRALEPTRRRLRVLVVQDAGGPASSAPSSLVDTEYLEPQQLGSPPAGCFDDPRDVVCLIGNDAVDGLAGISGSAGVHAVGLIVVVVPPGDGPCGEVATLCQWGSAVLLATSDRSDGLAWTGPLHAALAHGASVGEAVRRVNCAPAADTGTPWLRLYGGADTILVENEEHELPADDLRQVTSLSFDLVESTQWLRRLGGESYAGLLAAFHERCTEVIRSHGGVPDDPQGDDGIMSYFGLPPANEYAAEEAVKAAVGIVEAVRPLQVDVRVGVATGRVAVRAGQPVGVSIHLAARLQNLAAPGTVLLSESTHALVKQRFELEALPVKQRFKGIDEQQTVYQVKRDRSQRRGESRQSLTPFVGRESELASLVEHWERTRSGSLQVVLIKGEAGIGKSRLVREFRRLLKRRGHESLECACLPDSTHSAFHALSDALQRFLAFESGDDDATRIDKIARRVPPGYDPNEVVPLIAALLSIRCEPRFARLVGTPARLRDRTLATLTKWFQHETRATPTCLVVEDAHWIDPSSREFLDRLLANSINLPLMVLVTTRAETPQRWAPPTAHDEIDLGGLPPVAARWLIEQACGTAVLPARVVRQLTALADGVPLFLEESTRMALDQGAARDVDAQPLELDVPLTLQDLLMARLDRLGPAKTVAQLGALLGREFSVRLLEEVLTHAGMPLAPNELDLQLTAIAQSGLLTPVGDSTARGYAFKHALIREIAYQSLWERDRQRLHRAVAGVLQARDPVAVERHPELLAYHQTEAGLDDEALVQWEVAARAAAARSAHDEAISHTERALALLHRRDEDHERDRTELRLQLLLASACIATEGYGADRVERAYASAERLAEKLGDTPARLKVALGLEGVHLIRADFARAHSFAQRAASMAEAADDPMARLQAAWATANILFHEGHCEAAVRRMDECLAGYRPEEHRRSGVQNPAVMCLCYSAWGQWELGYPDDALKRIERVQALARELGHKFSQSEALGFAASVHRYRGEYDTALDCAEQAIAICEEGGFAVWLAHARFMRGWLLSQRGSVDAGLADMREGDALWRRTGAVVTRPLHLALLAEGLAHSGDLAGGLALLSQALALVQRHGERYFEAEIRRLTGELMLERAARSGGDATAEAEHWLTGAMEVARQQRKRGFELRCATTLARIWSRRGLRREAIGVLQPVLAWFTEGLETRDLRQARRVLNELGSNEERSEDRDENEGQGGRSGSLGQSAEVPSEPRPLRLVER